MIDKSVLIVEDDEILNSFLVEYMQNHFNEVYTSFDGEVALELYKKYNPVLLITDINMPKLSGIELIKKIREIDKEICIVVISAYADTNRLLEVIPLNLVKYLVKPVKSDDIKKVISDIKKNLQYDELIKLDIDLLFNIKTKQLTYKKDEIKLSKYEKDLISLLLQTPNNCVTYNTISQYVYELEEYSQNSLFSMIKRLRKKLPTDIITTCHKEGYKINTFKL